MCRWRIWSLREDRVLVLAPGVAVCACLLLVFWWPVLTASPISFGAWRSRVVFHDRRSNDQPEKLPMDANGQPRARVQLLHGGRRVDGAGSRRSGYESSRRAA